jgi:hypothetical protein
MWGREIEQIVGSKIITDITKWEGRTGEFFSKSGQKRNICLPRVPVVDEDSPVKRSEEINHLEKQVQRNRLRT